MDYTAQQEGKLVATKNRPHHRKKGPAEPAVNPLSEEQRDDQLGRLQQRLGEYLYREAERQRLSWVEIERRVRGAGYDMDYSVALRYAKMREWKPGAPLMRREVNFFTIWYLLHTAFGKSMAELEAALLSDRLLAADGPAIPGTREADAEALKVIYLSLTSPLARKQLRDLSLVVQEFDHREREVAERVRTDAREQRIAAAEDPLAAAEAEYTAREARTFLADLTRQEEAERERERAHQREQQDRRERQRRAGGAGK